MPSGEFKSGTGLADIIRVWYEGGWVMIPLALLTVYIYFEAWSMIFYLNRTGLRKTSRKVWLNWISKPQDGKGYLGEVISFVVGRGYTSEAVLGRIEEVKQEMLPDLNQKINSLSILVTVSPLMGLLGTVIGMLTTFQGLATSSGQTVDLVADGIRVALITTQTGLMIAIPGYLMIYAVIKRRNEFVAFLAQVETLALQYGAKKNSV